MVWFGYFFAIEFVWVLYILHINFYKIYSLPLSIVFIILLIVSYAVQKLFSLMWSHLSIFAFVAFAFGVKSKKSLPRPVSESLSPRRKYRSFMVSGLLFKSYSTLSCFCVWYNIYCCSVAKLCLTLCDPMDCRAQGSSILHCLLDFAQICVH